MSEEKKMYNPVELAKILQLSYRGVLLLVRQGRIKAVRIGKQWMTTPEELARIQREGTDK